uniref:Uncharacterized protein n=1 Tax=Chrysemys picta bellii TaxID=8478 RepID=A0A8C3FL11_CHRPI
VLSLSASISLTSSLRIQEEAGEGYFKLKKKKSTVLSKVNVCQVIQEPYNQAQWRVPVIPAICETQAGGSLELRGSGLQCAMLIECLVPLTA